MRTNRNNQIRKNIFREGQLIFFVVILTFQLNTGCNSFNMDEAKKANKNEANDSLKQSKKPHEANKYVNATKNREKAMKMVNESAASKKKQSKLKDQYLVENLRSKKKALLSKHTELTDSNKTHCKNIHYLDKPQKGLTDGSGNENYANNCNCQWKIKAPVGKRIKIQINKMNTQTASDILWIFNGFNANPENVLAKLSGDKSPIVITSTSNEVLLWFLTDTYITGKGWELDYWWVD